MFDQIEALERLAELSKTLKRCNTEHSLRSLKARWDNGTPSTALVLSAGRTEITGGSIGSGLFGVNALVQT